MEYKLLKKEKDDLKVSDLKFGDYFIFEEENTIDEELNAIFEVIESYSDLNKSYGLSLNDNTAYSLEDDLEVKITKVKPTKIEDDIMYFEEI